MPSFSLDTKHGEPKLTGIREYVVASVVRIDLGVFSHPKYYQSIVPCPTEVVFLGARGSATAPP